MHPSVKHLLEVIEAPTNAHTTVNHKAKQHFNPNSPYLQILRAVTPKAHSGAITQNIINCVVQFAFHQQTIIIPKFKFVAAMIHPKQKAQEFLDKQVNQSQGLICPALYQKQSPTGIMDRRIKKEQNTAGSFPTSKTKVQTIRRILLIAKVICSLKVQTFLNTLIKLQMAFSAKMTAQTVKNNPGGVTQRQYLLEIQPFLLPYMLTMAMVAPSHRKLSILIGHDFLPETPRSY